jgi:hypothetical protein
VTLDWRRPLIYTHRWLGIIGGVFFAMWFASGIVMMYARMPSLSSDERMARLPPLDLSRARIRPAEGARIAAVTPERIRIGMLGDRPVYRFFDGRWTTVFADSGERLNELTQDQAVDIARSFAPDPARVRYDAFLDDVDQWTFSVRGARPLHRVALDDSGDAFLYVSASGGEAVMKTTRSGRRWGYVGAVPHWLYFTALRRQAALWAQLVIWLSIAGCLLALSGLAWGLWRYSLTPRYRLKGVVSRSPYAGFMRWHHYAGLIFGVAALTWIFSGLLSMDPWAWSPGTSPSRAQREAIAGGSLQFEPLLVADLRDGLTALASAQGGARVREIETTQLEGTLYLIADKRLVAAFTPAQGAMERFDDGAMRRAAAAAMPDVPIENAEWLQSYDAYYYDRDGGLPLPVFRVRYMDPPRTWLYFDPRTGEIARKEEQLSRLNRWLYHGLHSLDFPFLYYRRPLWDITVVALSIGGLVLSLSTIPVGWHRLRRLYGSRRRYVGR